MRIDELLNPGTYSGSQNLRARVAHAISFAETVTRFRDDESPSPTAASIAAFLADAAAKCPGYVPPEPEPLPDNQVVVEDGQPVTIGGQEATILVDDGELSGVSLPATAGVVTDGQVLEVTGGTVTISVSGGTVSAEFTPDAE